MENMNAAFLKKKPTKRPLGVWREQLHQSSRKVLTETHFCFPVSPPRATNVKVRVRNKKMSSKGEESNSTTKENGMKKFFHSSDYPVSELKPESYEISGF